MLGEISSTARSAVEPGGVRQAEVEQHAVDVAGQHEPCLGEAVRRATARRRTRRRAAARGPGRRRPRRPRRAARAPERSESARARVVRQPASSPDVVIPRRSRRHSELLGHRAVREGLPGRVGRRADLEPHDLAVAVAGPGRCDTPADGELLDAGGARGRSPTRRWKRCRRGGRGESSDDLDACGVRRRSLHGDPDVAAAVQHGVGDDLGRPAGRRCRRRNRCRRSRSRTNRRASRTLSVVGGSRSSLTAHPGSGSAQRRPAGVTHAGQAIPSGRPARPQVARPSSRAFLAAAMRCPALVPVQLQRLVRRRGRAAEPGRLPPGVVRTARLRRGRPPAPRAAGSVIRARSVSVTATMSSPSATSIGSPTADRDRHLACARAASGGPWSRPAATPRSTVGSSGTPASAPSGRRRP